MAAMRRGVILGGVAAGPEGPLVTAARTGRTAVRARAVIRVESAPDGTARLIELRSDVPIVLRQTGASPGRTRAPSTVPALSADALPTATVHLVNATAGPLAGDDLGLDISVGSGVRLVVRSVAATVALPGHGPGPSRFTVSARVAPGGALDFAPEPTVAARGSDHLLVTDVHLATTAWLRLREEIVLGRFGETTGSIRSTLRVDMDAHAEVDPPSEPTPLLRQDLVLGPEIPGLTGPALLGSARALGSLLVAGPDPVGSPAARRESVPAKRAESGAQAAVADGVALLPLAGPGYLISALAENAVTLRRRLEQGPAPATV
ncbi:urease accessory protein UreH [Frankia casuarinae]|uniref:Urease accessory protein UreD n=1 Tax=Frankia casuarinae (strain DSM 45818 / CECT 9043 / HFP020203 / CcI3) TaxID=106370 RepID=URED_FRACC|nr:MULTISPECIES: urease accessory protein UreD [Frankia]Q2JES8.1 RecName: Full=Urease accessory protein UreD [Frankia casuarinae]ABD10214.1 putative urease accessory protein [Frankia casuarinae]ETA01612.1 urease accessory protein UreH [Frankia sp. CcI6]EYT93914.1 urease accessory protein UreH [Frankia casuarinae]KDA43439.1 urease accessory protein UreH [Frankia sp. BMG5.23]KEZ38412.1 urease accessory protein UreH [Frankia sp. CeD]